MNRRPRRVKRWELPSLNTKRDLRSAIQIPKDARSAKRFHDCQAIIEIKDGSMDAGTHPKDENGTAEQHSARLEDTTPLSAIEARILACLIEKELTTPDTYPLTLNTLVNACNQKSNRNPVLSLTDLDVERTLEGLRRKNLAVLFSGAHSHVPKFKHSFDQVYPVGTAERVILCGLMLRGPQTPGELRTRCGRMHPFENTSAVMGVLQDLMDHPGQPLVTRLERLPGQKEARYAETLSARPVPAAVPAATSEPMKVEFDLPPEVEERLHRLEETCAALQSKVSELKDLILNL
jgi:uncharacterized protein YceH (UPF0502 family)